MSRLGAAGLGRKSTPTSVTEFEQPSGVSQYNKPVPMASLTGQWCVCDVCDGSKWDTVVKAEGTCVRVHMIGFISLLAFDRPFAHMFPSNVGCGDGMR